MHPAKRTEPDPNLQNQVVVSGTIGIAYVTTESNVCPFCHSKEYTEAPPEPATEQRTEAVLVIDLVTGENLALNKALADGYEIVGRYAKQYTLEKKKPKEQST
jgi:hypothetical protein